MRISGKTDIGRSRAENQDNYRSGNLMNGTAWGIVCDGMGGGQNGRLASTMAADILEERLYKHLSSGIPDEEIPKLLSDSIRLANAEIFARSGNGQLVMGTTVVCAVVKGQTLHLAHVGDSRAYLFEGGELKQLTRDHSMVQELLDQGALTAAEAKRHPEKNVITRALGVEAMVEAEYNERELWPGSVLLLCTDGLTNMVSPQHISSVLARGDFYDAAGTLVADALAAGGSDNITVLLMQVQEEETANG